jgi:oxygen-dependent protoporphyrinogen oxidase
VGILVIGGGITGLTAAYALGRSGVPVTLVEADGRLGGKVRTERVGDLLVEEGPDSVIATRPAALELARELGLGDELVGVREPRGVFIVHRGRLVPMPEGLGLVLPTRAMPFARTRLFSWPEKARMGLDVVMPRVLPPGDVAVGAFLRRRLGDALVERLAGPLVGGIYGTPIDELSLDAVVPTLRDAERDHRSLLFAGLAQGRAQARSAARAREAATAPGPTPGHPSSGASSSGASSPGAPSPGAPSSGGAPAGPRRSLGMFVSLAGGMGRLTDVLAATARSLPGVEIRTGVALTSLERRAGGTVAHLSDGSVIVADAVVVTTSAPAAAAILGSVVPQAPELPALLGAIPHGSTAIVTLAYPWSAFATPPVGHGFLVPADEALGIAACTISSGKWPGRAPDDTVLLRAFVADGPALAGSDQALVALARADIARALSARGEPSLARVARWSGAMPRYTVGHLERVAAIERALAAAAPTVLLAGAPYRGVGIPDCVSQGRAAAERVLGVLGGTGVPATAARAVA